MPIVNTRISVTPIAIAAAGAPAEAYVEIAKTLQKAVDTTVLTLLEDFQHLWTEE